MKKLLALLLPIFMVFTLVGAALAAPIPEVIYDSTPQPLPPNLPSLGYQATATAEFGDQIQFAGASRTLQSVTVTMSSWALHSTYPSMPAAGFMHPITFNIYAVNHATSTPAPGALLATTTQTFLIPWRPAADPTCPGGTAWRAGDNQCYNGFAFNITFDMSNPTVTLPTEVIYGVAYNTNTWGYHPIGLPGPYESLNVGLSTAATVGTDVDPDAVFWNTSVAGFYTDGGASGVGTFRPYVRPRRSSRRSPRRPSRTTARMTAGRNTTTPPSRIRATV